MAPTPGMNQPARSGGFNAYAAGDKRYGGGRTFPNLGPTDDPIGYRERNLQIKARQNAILNRMKQNSRSIKPNSSARNDYIQRNNDGTGSLRAPSTVSGGMPGGTN